MNRREKLISYIREHVDDEFEDDQDLLDIMDSVTLLQFMVHIEQSFGVTINQAELTIEVFESIDTVIEAFFEVE